MPPRTSHTPHASASTAGLSMSHLSSSHSPKPSTSCSPLGNATVWVDPASLPNGRSISKIGGNAPDYVKQLTDNTFVSYGLGNEDCFGHDLGKEIKFVEVNVNKNIDRQGRQEAMTVAEIVVSKRMLNGAGMLHGACVAYFIDICCATPLVVLGLIQKVNGVGVTQAMNILFHSPAPPGTCLRVISTSITIGGRIMTSRCEIIDKFSGRMVSSAFLNKMQPRL